MEIILKSFEENVVDMMLEAIMDIRYEIDSVLCEEDFERLNKKYLNYWQDPSEVYKDIISDLPDITEYSEVWDYVKTEAIYKLYENIDYLEDTPELKKKTLIIVEKVEKIKNVR